VQHAGGGAGPVLRRLRLAFQWGEGSWGKAVGKEAVENSNLGFDKEEEAREEQLRRSAPAYNPVDRRAPEDHSIETKLNELDDTLQLIAAMPYLDEEDEQQRAIKVHFEQGSGLDNLDAQGYTVKAGVLKMWQGERDLNMLVKGADADSAILLQRILMHTLEIERQLEKGGAVGEDAVEKVNPRFDVEEEMRRGAEAEAEAQEVQAANMSRSITRMIAARPWRT
jgi:hypothetical protein